MQLIGMLDSPYVRRVAISLRYLGLTYEHQALSVFRHVEQFTKINPLVKAPTLVCDDGTVLMDSSLILQYAEALAGRSLLPSDPAALSQALRMVGLAINAYDKSAQILYETQLRPIETQHPPWLERITGQLHSAYRLLEGELAQRPLKTEQIDQVGISVAVAWYFTQHIIPGTIDPAPYPELTEFSRRAEQLPEFKAVPYGE